MSLDSDDEWLRELLEPEPPSRRRRISDDDVEAALFLDELLSSAGSRLAMPATLLALPVARPAQAARRAARPRDVSAPPAALPAPARPAGQIAAVGRSAQPSHTFPCQPASATRGESSATSLLPQTAGPKVAFKLPNSKCAGAVLAHAMQLVHDVTGREPTIFKIGITADPAHRWGNAKYGYKYDRDKYQQMLVFSEADSAGAAMLEASLISIFKTTRGCRNTAPGGESVRQGCSIYTYIVFRHLGAVRAAGG